jgi:hypothetical protein
MLLLDMVTIVVLCLLCELVAALVFVKFIVMKYAGKAVIERLIDPDEDTRQAVGSLLSIVLAAEIKTGKTITDDEGRERAETVPFIRYVGREIWTYLGTLRKASNGGTNTAIAQQIGLPSGPRKGQSTMEYLFEQMIMRAGPQIDELISKKVNEITNK